MGLNLGTGLGGSGLVGLDVSTGLGGSGLQASAGQTVAQAEAVIAAFNPIAWYKFDEGAGSSVNDYGSVGADLTLGGSGGAWVTGGHDSQGTAYWDSSNTLGITGTDARTLIAAASPQTIAVNVGFAVEWDGQGAPAGNGNRWTLRTVSNGTNLRMEIAGEGFTETTLDNFSAGAWAFVAGSMASGGTKLTDCDLYMNGGTQACTGSTVTINTTGNFQIGRIISAVQDQIIGYCLAFDTELSAANIAALRTALTTIMAARGITLP